MVFQRKKKGVKSSLNFEVPGQKLKNLRQVFCRSALLLSICENRFFLSQSLKKLNSTERGTPFPHFCVPKVITTAHVHKSGVNFHFFQEL